MEKANYGYEDLGYAKIDSERKERTGQAEVIFCEGKPNEYLEKIFKTIYEKNGEVLGTRASEEQYNILKQGMPEIEYNKISRIIKIAKPKELMRKHSNLYRRYIRHTSCGRISRNSRIFWKQSRKNLRCRSCRNS